MPFAADNCVRCGELPVSGLGVVHLVYNALRDLPGRYNLCTHSLSALFGSYFGELYRSVQQVYENSVRCRLLCTVSELP